MVTYWWLSGQWFEFDRFVGKIDDFDHDLTATSLEWWLELRELCQNSRIAEVSHFINMDALVAWLRYTRGMLGFPVGIFDVMWMNGNIIEHFWKMTWNNFQWMDEPYVDRFVAALLVICWHLSIGKSTREYGEAPNLPQHPRWTIAKSQEQLDYIHRKVFEIKSRPWQTRKSQLGWQEVNIIFEYPFLPNSWATSKQHWEHASLRDGLQQVQRQTYALLTGWVQVSLRPFGHILL